ncbi:MAG TPA: bifunctional histidinol-phosphatase/imidazoleglycerol-phosphate dehydratase HisB [Prolixibacteraceae bacterium]|nr:bifunctional histidinol-phosphatase/imidazoleglycerol-phosphate dehydratase HisB [Prolixibacteraceae bacterium]
MIVEPPWDFQVDTLEKLEFVPGVIRNLRMIRDKLPFELVMVSNQDGLGTPGYPQEDFDLVQGKILKTLENEGVVFDDILIDSTFPEENAPTRKPGTAMMGQYMKGNHDLAGSFVIGDRLTDLMLAANLGAKCILYTASLSREEVEAEGLSGSCALITTSWDEIYAFLAMPARSVTVERKTRETDIRVELSLDGTGKTDISTGLGFLDHMLEQIGRHAGCDLTVKAKGDLHVDEHHTVEDTALALGEAFGKALRDKAGMERYGFVLPMDDSLATVALDFGGRPWLVWKAHFRREKVGDLPTELIFHFFKSFADTARCNLYMEVTGDNDHHQIEALFKGFARAVRMALRRDPFNFELPSTKGTL